MRIKSSNKIIRLLIEIEHDFYIFTKVLEKKIGKLLAATGDLIYRQPAPVPRNLKNNIFLSLLIKAIWYLPQIIIYFISILIGVILFGGSLAFFLLLPGLLGLNNGFITFLSFFLWLFFLNRYIFHTDDISIH